MTRKQIEAAERKLVEQYHNYETNTNSWRKIGLWRITM